MVVLGAKITPECSERANNANSIMRRRLHDRSGLMLGSSETGNAGYQIRMIIDGNQCRM